MDLVSVPTPPELPNETLVHVFEYLSHTSLSTVTCVSQRFRSVAERLLYATATLIDSITDTSPTPSRTGRWCESLAQRPHLQDAVKAVHIHWYTDPTSSFADSLDATCVQLSAVLRRLHSIESLELFLGSASAAVPSFPPSLHSSTVVPAIETILHGCVHPQLRRCVLSTEGNAMYPSTDILDTFFRSAPELTSLKLLDRFPAVNLSADVLPILSTFRGSPNAAATILPGRPIVSLAIVGIDSDVTRENLYSMTLGSLPVRLLDLSSISITPKLFQGVCTHFPLLHVLKVKLALRHTLHYAISGIRLLAGLSSVLSVFQELIQLDLSPTGLGVSRANGEQELALCLEWTRSCPSLQTITFPSGTEWLRRSNSFLDTWSAGLPSP